MTSNPEGVGKVANAPSCRSRDVLGNSRRMRAICLSKCGGTPIKVGGTGPKAVPHVVSDTNVEEVRGSESIQYHARVSLWQPKLP